MRLAEAEQVFLNEPPIVAVDVQDSISEPRDASVISGTAAPLDGAAAYATYCAATRSFHP